MGYRIAINLSNNMEVHPYVSGEGMSAGTAQAGLAFVSGALRAHLHRALDPPEPDECPRQDFC